MKPKEFGRWVSLLEKFEEKDYETVVKYLRPKTTIDELLEAAEEAKKRNDKVGEKVSRVVTAYARAEINNEAVAARERLAMEISPEKK